MHSAAEGSAGGRRWCPHSSPTELFKLHASKGEHVVAHCQGEGLFHSFGWAVKAMLWFTVMREVPNCKHSNAGWNVCAHRGGISRECASVAGRSELQKGLLQVKHVSKMGWLHCGGTLEFAVDPCSQGMQWATWAGRNGSAFDLFNSLSFGKLVGFQSEAEVGEGFGIFLQMGS